MSVGTIGLPGPDNTIFYHPLDSNLRETTSTEVWTGTGQAVPGKIGTAQSAIATSTIAFGANSIYASGTVNLANEQATIVAISDSVIVGLYTDVSANKSYGRVGTILANELSWGSTSGIFRESGAGVAGARNLHATIIDTDKVLVVYGLATDAGGFARIGTVSGTTITFGEQVQFESDRLNGEIRVDAMDDEFACIYYRNGTTGDGDVRILQIVGTGIVVGDSFQPDALGPFTNPGGLTISALSSTILILSNSEMDKVYAGERTGTNLVFGDSVAIAATQQTWMSSARISDTEFMVAITQLTSGSLQYGTVDGTTISLDSHGQLYHSTRVNAVDMTLISDGRMGFAFIDQNNDLYDNIGTIVNGVITMANARLIRDKSRTPWIIGLSDTTLLSAGMIHNDASLNGSAFVSHSTIDISVSISGTSAYYPSVSGASRLVVSMWANDLATAGSTVTIERGYNIVIDDSSITLGSGTCVWNDDATLDVIGVMNNGDDHFLVLDFEHVSAGNWNLSTSLDGDPFVDQGLQNAGSTSLATIDTNPSLAISGGFPVEQWIDELTMWAGDNSIFAQFTDQELSNMYDVAQLGDLALSSHDSYLSSLTVVEGFSVSLVPDTWAENIDAPAKILTMTKTITLSPTASGTAVSGTVDFFDKTIPFDCEVVGVRAIMIDITTANFNGSGGSVTVVIESSNKPDISPRVPYNEVSMPDASWDTLIPSVDCETVAIDGLCFDSPSDGTNIMDQTHVDLRQFSSLRAVVTAQVEDAYVTASGITPVSMTLTAEIRPVNIRDRRFL